MMVLFKHGMKWAHDLVRPTTAIKHWGNDYLYTYGAVTLKPTFVSCRIQNSQVVHHASAQLTMSLRIFISATCIMTLSKILDGQRAVENILWQIWRNFVIYVVKVVYGAECITRQQFQLENLSVVDWDN